MKQNRRDFIKTGALITGGTAIGLYKDNLATTFIKNPGTKMKLTFKPFTLNMKHVFTVAVHSRTTTPVVLTEIEYDGIKGYGEASMPPYLGESQESVSTFFI